MALSELSFDLLFNSPAFLGTVPVGTKRVEYLQRNRAGKMESSYSEAVFYPVDPRGVRIPSLRGILEMWSRSLLGHLPSTEVFAHQEKVFGSAGGGQGLSIRPAGMPRLDKHKGELSFSKNWQPLLYLGYGPLQYLNVQGQGTATSFGKKIAREALLVEPEPRPRFRFVARGRTDQIDELRRALVLLHLFGGLGARSRRGWGSIEVTGLPVGSPPKVAGALPEWITSSLATVWRPRPGEEAEPAFSAFSQGTRIYVTKVFEGDYQEALLELYRHFHRVRSYKDSSLASADHALERSDYDRQPEEAITAVPARIAFGMPYQPGHENGWRMTYEGRPAGPGGENKETTVTRRASPLLLKVLRLGPRHHAGIALFLKARFFGTDLEIGAKGKNLTLPFPGYGAIDQFFTDRAWISVPLPSPEASEDRP